MQLPENRESWIKFAVSETERAAFAEASKGRLYFTVPQLQPGAIDACVWRVDPDGGVFRIDTEDGLRALLWGATIPEARIGEAIAALRTNPEYEISDLTLSVDRL